MNQNQHFLIFLKVIIERVHGIKIMIVEFDGKILALQFDKCSFMKWKTMPQINCFHCVQKIPLIYLFVSMAT